VDVFHRNLEAVEASGAVTLVAKLLLGFLLTMPSEAAKKARTWEMKWHSSADSLSQSTMSAVRLISFAVQKDASAFLYIRQMSAWWMGKSTKQCGFSFSSGSGARSPLVSAVLCFDGRLGGVGAFSAFRMVWAVLVQNSFQSLPLLQMKLVISQKAWYVTTCWMGMVWYGEGEGCVFDK
jgi:hypothetical protein